MATYTEWVKVILGESAKYISLLLFSVLAIRLWRRLPRLSVGKRRKNFLLACAASVMACVVGYLSICHSLGLLYSYYGMRAFNSGYILPAFSLFEKSSGYWKNADVLGRQGVCLLFLEHPDQGMQLLDDAKTLRGGSNSSFEEYYEGLYFFFDEKPAMAVPLLETASLDLSYRWNVIKLFAVLELDNNQPQDAEHLMQPFAQVEAADFDLAYVRASLDLFEGKKAEAKALADKFDTGNLPPFWKSRFDKLRAKIQNQTP